MPSKVMPSKVMPSMIEDMHINLSRWITTWCVKSAMFKSSTILSVAFLGLSVPRAPGLGAPPVAKSDRVTLGEGPIFSLTESHWAA